MTMKKILRTTSALMCVGGAFVTPALAQERPNAGQLFQENRQQLQPPKESDGLSIEGGARSGAVPEGGVEVTLSEVIFEGNTLFKDPVLEDLIGPVAGKTFTFAQMRALTDQISDFYRQEGYIFARAFLPKQQVTEGILVIAILEGKFGESRIIGEDDLVARVQRYYSRFKKGDILSSAQLERVTLLVDDLPGMKQTVVVRPADSKGAGDLVVHVEPDKGYDMTISADNHGNRYTAKNKASLDANFHGAVLVGDTLSVGLSSGGDNMKLGRLEYSAPVGADGMRVNGGVSYTDYELGKEFKDLRSNGETTSAHLGVSYPLYRGQETNVSTSGTVTRKWIIDRTDSVEVIEKKQTTSLNVRVSADHRDGFLSGGVTYGAFDWTLGDLTLDNSLAATDRLSAQREGIYNKVGLNVARIQNLPESFQLFARVNGQKAFNNLDSSEGLGIGGVNGVRAYPSGEGYGDEGYVTQAEVRYLSEYGSPFVFYDFAQSWTNYDPWDNSENERKLGGYGLGLRVSYEGFFLEGMAAWRTQGGDPQSDSKDNDPLVWVSLKTTF